MRVNNNYYINKEGEYIIIYYSGEVGLEEIKELLISMGKDKNYSPKYSTVNDLRDCNLIADLAKLKEYIEFVKQNMHTVDIRKTAFLTSQPIQVVLTQLFSDSIQKFNVNSKVFTTSKAAIEWLANPNLDPTYYDIIINEIRANNIDIA